MVITLFLDDIVKIIAWLFVRNVCVRVVKSSNTLQRFHIYFFTPFS